MNNSQMQARIARVAGRVRGLTDEQLARMAANGADLTRLQAAVQDLQRVVAEGMAGAQARNGFAASLSPAFPDASYSLLCGSTRTITEIVFAAQVALQVAQGVWTALSRACDEVVVVLGEGGNLSLPCIVADEVLFAAQAVLDDFMFCDGDIDSAEIEGAYERTAHLHGDLESLDNKVDATRDVIVNNDNGNTGAIVNNDNSNRNAILTNDNNNTGAIITNDNLNRDTVTQLLGDQFKAAEWRQIEDNLSHHECPAWMYTPAYADAPANTVFLGGRFEEVLNVIRNLIGNASKLGINTRHAQRELDEAVKTAARRPLMAARVCEGLLDAYRAATVHHHESGQPDR